ncbi:M4 family metallopeptidase [Bacillus cereus]|uniref:M4 family metallopeptidase n=1 Tax=Bacillus cereus TaxID=1396 RepID=UPI000C28DAB3|nr:M4 family metallopeptidase [Bacillus cereus]
MKNTNRIFGALLLTGTAFISPILPTSSFAESNPTISKEKYNDVIGSMEFISGQLTTPSSQTIEDVVFKYIDENKDKYNLGVKNAKESFTVQKKETDDFGTTIVRLQQVYNGIPVHGSTQIAHINNQGILTVFSGTVVPELDGNLSELNAIISPEKAISIAEKDLNLKIEYEQKPTSKLAIYNKENETKYAYIVQLNFLSPQPGNYYYFIDVTTGEILSKYDSIDKMTSQRGNALQGIGKGVLNDYKYINMTSTNYSDFKLEDITRGTGIFTYDAKNQWMFPSTVWSSLNRSLYSKYDAPAVDAHYHSGIVYDFYKNYFNRNSYDNKGGPIRSIVHYGQNYNNALWNGFHMVYGDGDGQNSISFSGALDVVAHEFTHAVTQYSSGLIYENESGALNESISDLFGTLVEFYEYKNPDYEIGEDVYTPNIPNDAMRSMSDPRKYNQPDHYSNRYIGAADKGGVHINSGIINKSMYLLAEGGTHYGISVPGISLYKVGQIYYRANSVYFTQRTTFSQAKIALVQAAADLFGQGSTEMNAVQKSFDAVGIY